MTKISVKIALHAGYALFHSCIVFVVFIHVLTEIKHRHPCIISIIGLLHLPSTHERFPTKAQPCMPWLFLMHCHCTSSTSINLHGDMCTMSTIHCCHSGKLWYLQHNCVGDIIVYHWDRDINYGISNTIVLEIWQFTTKAGTLHLHLYNVYNTRVVFL